MRQQQFNYLALTDEQKEFVRQNSTKISIEAMTKQLRVSRHEIMKLVMVEKLSIKVKKNWGTVKKRPHWTNDIFRGGV